MYLSTQTTCLNIASMLRKYSSISTRLAFIPKQRNMNFTLSVRIMKDGLSFILFSFLFYFSFDLLSILNLGLEFSIISYIMVTKCYMNMTWCHILVI